MVWEACDLLVTNHHYFNSLLYVFCGVKQWMCICEHISLYFDMIGKNRIPSDKQEAAGFWVMFPTKREI